MLHVLYTIHPAQAGATAAVNDVLASYSAPDEDLTAPLASSRDGLAMSVPSGYGGVLRGVAVSTLLRMVSAAEPARGRTAADALKAVFRQMRLDGDSVARPAESAAAAAFDGQVGDGTAVLDVMMPTGLPNGLVVPEAVAQLVVDRDSRTGGATEGAEAVRYVGEPATAPRDDAGWPAGSGADRSFTAGAAALDYPTGRQNRLVNGSFDAWTAGVPDNWALESGAITEETSLSDGDGSAVRVAAGATAVLSQAFDDADGTTATLSATTAHAVAVRLRASAALSGGTLTLELYDDDAAAVAFDDAGAASRVTVGLSGVSTAYAWHTGVLRTPAVLPASYSVRVSVTSTPVGGDLLIDRFGLQPVTYPYPGGPGVAVFAGPTAFATGDGWTVAVTNDFAGADYAATWAWALDRLYDLKATGLRPPYDASPTVSDTLITADPSPAGVGGTPMGLLLTLTTA